MRDQTPARTHAGAWNLIAGALLGVAVVSMGASAVLGQAGLFAAGLSLSALSIAAGWAADRDLNRLLAGVATQARYDLEAEIGAQHEAVAESEVVAGRIDPRWVPPVQLHTADPRPIAQANKSAGKSVGT